MPQEVSVRADRLGHALCVEFKDADNVLVHRPT